VDEINRAIPAVSQLAPMAAAPVKKLLNERAKVLGFLWNPAAKAFVVPVAKTA
jgi:hypothetical protein